RSIWAGKLSMRRSKSWPSARPATASGRLRVPAPASQNETSVNERARRRSAPSQPPLRIAMSTSNQPNLMQVDWSKIPAPGDDGAARHLEGLRLPDIALAATDGRTVSLARCQGRTVVYAYPRMGKPGQIALIDGWDEIPGARGCTPQSCAFRDHFAE